VFETEVVEKIITRILCSITFGAVYEIVCKYMVVPDRPQVTIWLMRIACWVTKAADTHSEFVILIASPATMVTPRRFSVTFIRTLPVLLQVSVWYTTRPGNARSGIRSGERLLFLAARKDQLCRLCSGLRGVFRGDEVAGARS
jgi:hypothetical protein